MRGGYEDKLGGEQYCDDEASARSGDAEVDAGGGWAPEGALAPDPRAVQPTRIVRVVGGLVGGVDGAVARMRFLEVGACPSCGVTFIARLEQCRAVREVLRVHAIVCPGGERSAEVAAPYEAIEGRVVTRG